MLNLDFTEQIEGILADNKVAEPPVPVDKIAKKLGLLLCQLPVHNDISGAIVRKGDHVVVAINPSHPPTRQRFTIAHEIAHFLLHGDLMEHVDRDLWVSWRNAESSQASDWNEVEANNFAAQLLMPASFVRRDVATLGQISKNSVPLLAKRYNVSAQAMEFRLINLGLRNPF